MLEQQNSIFKLPIPIQFSSSRLFMSVEKLDFIFILLSFIYLLQCFPTGQRDSFWNGPQSCSMWTSPKLIKTGFVVRHRNTHPLMPGRHFLIKPAVCRAEEMKELFFPFLWDSRSQSSHALQQGWARVERTVWSLRLWMSLWDSRSHLHYTTNKQRSKQ